MKNAGAASGRRFGTRLDASNGQVCGHASPAMACTPVHQVRHTKKHVFLNSDSPDWRLKTPPPPVMGTDVAMMPFLLATPPFDLDESYVDFLASPSPGKHRPGRQSLKYIDFSTLSMGRADSVQYVVFSFSCVFVVVLAF